MARIVAIIAAAFLLSGGIAHAEKWSKVGEKTTGGTSGRVYWDLDSLTLDNDRLRLRSRIDFAKPTVAQQYGAPVKSIRSDFDIHCGRLTGRHVLSELFGADGKVVFTLRGGAGATVVPAPTAFDVCQRAKARAS